MTFYDNTEFCDSVANRKADGSLCKTTMIVAPDGCGRGFAARLLAARYLFDDDKKMQHFLKNGNSDVTVIEGEGASGEIKIDRVRDVRRDAFGTSFSQSGRVFIFKDAHRLNKNSANALLKILEEPPRDVLFILTTSSADAVLPTIRSRCGIYYISPVSTAVTDEFLSEQKLTKREKELCAAAYHGRLGSIIKTVQNKKQRALLCCAGEAADAAIAKNQYLMLLALCGKGKPERRETAYIYETLSLILTAAANGRYGSDIDRDFCLFGAVSCNDAIIKLQRNINQKLIDLQLTQCICK